MDAIKKVPIRNGFGEGLVALGKTDASVVMLCCDLVESTRSEAFARAYPLRFVEMGVAEQNMAGVAAGMALVGKKPFMTSYSVFSPGRNWDQVRVSICYNRADVKIVGSHAGLSVGPDGATHQALEDIAVTRVLPNMAVVVPCDAIEARKATLALGAHVGPAYLRLAREATAVVTDETTPFEIGKANVMREGDGVTIVACGAMVPQALAAAEELSKKGISAEVINMHTVKPLDAETLLASVGKTGKVVTIEEHQITGGLGGAVAECLAGRGAWPVEIIGVNDSFGQSGTPDELWAHYGLDVPSIVDRITKRYF